MTQHAGDSSEQREAEKELLSKLSKNLGVTWNKEPLPLMESGRIELDGFCKESLVFCEAWAHIGPPKPAQKNKVMADALKLLFAKAQFNDKGTCILLFADHAAAAPFQGKSWMAQCLKKFDIKIEVIELSPEKKAEVLNAQKRQYR